MRAFSQQEQQALADAEVTLRDNGLIVDQSEDTEAANHNAERFIAFFETNPRVIATIDSILNAAETDAWAAQMALTIRAEFGKLARRMPGNDLETILSFISRRDLKNEGDNLMHNAITLAKYLAAKQMPVDEASLNLALTNVASVPGYKLLWRPARLQDSEKERWAARDAAKQRQPAQRANDDVVIPAGLPAYLHQHYIDTHRPTTKVVPVTEKSTANHFKKMAEDAVDSMTSVMDRQEAAAKYLSKGDAWTWELVYKQVMSYIERRANQRSQVGR